MRDIALAALFFSLLPFALMRADIGILVWTWIGLMNPHRLTFGWARTFPFAMIVGGTTILAILLSKEKKSLPLFAPVVALLVLDVWMLVTTFFAMYQEEALDQLERVAKIQLFIFLTMVVMQSRERLKALVIVSALSIAYFGIKGGVYTILKGGHGMVLGPDGGFVAGNTEISLALTMALPLMRWIQTQVNHTGLKWLIGIFMALMAVSILGSYSRGGFLALAAMGIWFWFKGNRKVMVALFLMLLVPAGLTFMPDEWWARMGTIQSYEQSGSAQSRLNSWRFAWNLAEANPVVGGGFSVFREEAFELYAPDPTRVWDSHSIWFTMLGEHGFVGLALFLLLWISSWRLANRIIREARDREDLRWAGDLAAMIQVSFIGYWVGGSFLSLAYWDYPYILVATLVVMRVVVLRERSARKGERPVTGFKPVRIGPQVGRSGTG
jgi:probable O-glycosylation ligase (exosortase A-associated)